MSSHLCIPCTVIPHCRLHEPLRANDSLHSSLFNISAGYGLEVKPVVWEAKNGCEIFDWRESACFTSVSFKGANS